MAASQYVRSLTAVYPYSLPLPARSRSASIRGIPCTAQQPSPSALAARQRDVRSKIVAGILLNRVHAVGKPIRRRPPCTNQPRPYVPSGLSTCIACDA